MCVLCGTLVTENLRQRKVEKSESNQGKITPLCGSKTKAFQLKTNSCIVVSPTANKCLLIYDIQENKAVKIHRDRINIYSGHFLEI